MVLTKTEEEKKKKIQLRVTLSPFHTNKSHHFNGIKTTLSSFGCHDIIMVCFHAIKIKRKFYWIAQTWKHDRVLRDLIDLLFHQKKKILNALFMS